MRRYWEQLRRKLRGAPRIVAAACTALVLSLSLYSSVLANSVVTVTDTAGRDHTMLTPAPTSEILQMANAVAAPNDQLVYTARDDGDASVVIHRAFPVSLLADGWVHRAEFVEGTVADLLAACNVVLEQDDFVTPSLDTPLMEGLQAEVHRVRTRTETEVLERAEVDEAEVDAYIAARQAQDPDFTFKKANRGLYNITYEHTLVNGEIFESEITALEAIMQPREPGSTAFEPGIPCSRIESFEDFEVEFGPDGKPLNARRVMPNAVCTAYSASRGRGSSGLGLYNGTVAVNPNVIPYGTKLYITSADGSFVYGYAIATDTGGAMMEGRVDVDLFFETNGECLRFGKRTLEVYILE